MKNYKKLIKSLLCIVFLSVNISQSKAQLTVSTTLTPQQLVQNVLVGSGVIISNVSYTGSTNAIGFFQGGGSTNLGIGEGIIMSSGVVNGTPTIGSPASNFASTNNLQSGDPQLSSIASAAIYDASVLQFDFNPLSDTIRFRYVFGSEEYPEYVNAGYNDVFGYFISGPNPSGGNYTNENIAKIPNTSLSVSLDNVNAGSYAQYYVSNGAGTSIVWDGFTKVLTAWCKVIPCQLYHIKIAVGDAGDGIYDTGVFLESMSLGTGLIYLPPTIDSISSNQNICVGEPAFYTVDANNPLPGNLNYQWQLSNDNGNTWINIDNPGITPVYSGYLTDSLSLTNITIASSENLYRCAITNMPCTPPVFSESASLNVLNLGQPDSIIGNITVCQGQQNVMYSIPLLPNATSYIWTLPSGATGTSNTHSINVNYGISAISGNISIKGTNGCGDGPNSSKGINVNPLPSAAGSISGETEVCQGQNSVSYSVNPIADATSYIWTIPVGSTGVSTISNISVNFGGSAISGNITVKGKNTCGNGSSSFLPVTVNYPRSMEMCYVTFDTLLLKNQIIWYVDPSQTVIDSVTVEVKNSFGNFVTIGTTNYNQGHLIDQSSNPASGIYEYRLLAVNRCGNGLVSQIHSSLWLSELNNELRWYNYDGNFSPSYYNVYAKNIDGSIVLLSAIPPCSGAGCINSVQIFNNPNITNFFIAFQKSCSYIKSTNWVLSNYLDWYSGISKKYSDNITIFPNPFSDKFIIESNGASDKIYFEIYNAIGQIVFSGNLTEKTIIRTATFPTGIYLIKLSNGKTIEFKKIIKE